MSERPILGLDIDGVVAVEAPPGADVHEVRVSAWGRWNRSVLVPTEARDVVAELAEVYDIVWVSAWGHNAHTSWATELGIQGDKWPFLPVQFGQAWAVANYALDRPWALVNDGTDQNEQAPTDGAIVHVDAHKGLADLDVQSLIRHTFEIAATRRELRGSHEQEKMS